jgi:uncharacterized DUF497 family protein
MRGGRDEGDPGLAVLYFVLVREFVTAVTGFWLRVRPSLMYIQFAILQAGGVRMGSTEERIKHQEARDRFSGRSGVVRRSLSGGIDGRFDYGEERVVAFGEVQGRVIAVVYTWREGRRRIVSARRATKTESRAFSQVIYFRGEHDEE